MSWRGLLAVILLVVGIVLSWRVVNRPERAPVAPPLLDSRLGYYLREATIRGIAEDGAPLYELTAGRILHYPADDSVTLEEVLLDYGAHGEAPWRLEADRGAIPAGGETILLDGNVRMRSDRPARGSLEVTTSQLEIIVQERLARTSESVQLTEGGDRLTAVGLRADLNAERLELLADVHGVFARSARR